MLRAGGLGMLAKYEMFIVFNTFFSKVVLSIFQSSLYVFLITVFSLFVIVCYCCLQDDTGAGAGLGTSTANVNRYIQQLAQEYSGDCKTSFDELSKIIQVKEGEHFF